MTLDEYQQAARTTAKFPNVSPGDGRSNALGWVYPLIGLSGEVGELSEKLKKVWRDNDGFIPDDQYRLIYLELGDALWYLANVASELGLSLDYIASENLNKLSLRRIKGTLHGAGDER